MTITGEKGTVEGKPQIQDGKVSGTFTVVLSSFKTGISLRDEHMREDLRTATYPIATYDMMPSAFEGSKEFPINGTLELNGIKKPLSGTAVFKGKTLNATLIVKLKDFGLHQRTHLGIGVGDSATVKME